VNRVQRLIDRWWMGPRIHLRDLKAWPADLKDRRRYKPGGFFLDHGYTPCVIVADTPDKDAVHGVSMLDGKFTVSDRYHCGPKPCTQAEAIAAVNEIRRIEGVTDRTGILGTEWKDSNGHHFRVDWVEGDGERSGEPFFALHGESWGCDIDICGPIWHEMHTSYEGQMRAHAYGTEEAIKDRDLFGWELVK